MEESKFEGVEGENNPEVLIQSANNFDELYEALYQIGEIQGSQKFYSPENLFGLIEGVRSKDVNIRFITNTYKLRDKVQELLEAIQ